MPVLNFGHKLKSGENMRAVDEVPQRLTCERYYLRLGSVLI